MSLYEFFQGYFLNLPWIYGMSYVTLSPTDFNAGRKWKVPNFHF